MIPVRSGAKQIHTDLAINDLLDYTDWERQQWLEWLRQRGGPALEISARPHGDGRFEKVGELVRHMFSAEKRYVFCVAAQIANDHDISPGGVDSFDPPL